MNEHLEFIFKAVLPTIESRNINYWVYGGVAIAAIGGKFLRSNDDVDIFVKFENFEEVKRILNDSKKDDWKIKESVLENGRPKIELSMYDSSKDILAVIPVYIINNSQEVEFKFPGSSKIFSIELLSMVDRVINGYHFFTPPDQFIINLFEYYLEVLSKNGKIRREDLRKKYINDAKAVLPKDKYFKYFS